MVGKGVVENCENKTTLIFVELSKFVIIFGGVHKRPYIYFNIIAKIFMDRYLYFSRFVFMIIC